MPILSTKLRTAVILLISVAALALGGSARATPAISFTSPGLTGSGDNETLGYAFDVSTALMVTDLGVWDMNLNGLIQSHEVGIWDNLGNKLVSTIVPAGTTAILINGFRYFSVSPTLLTPGSYAIGAFYEDPRNSDDVALMANGFATDARISFQGGRQAAGPFSNPVDAFFTSLNPDIFGPNFLFDPAAVPEPSSLALFGITLLPLAGITRRRRRTA